MSVDSIEQAFKEKVCDALQLQQEGIDRYRVVTPFMFDDGDHLGIVLKRDDGHWVLSDEGHTYMHLTYDLDESDLRQGNRQKIIANALLAYSVSDESGELVLKIPEEKYGDALYSFVQALLKITDVRFLSREVVRSTFIDDLESLIVQKFPAAQRYSRWHDPIRDPERNYEVDWRIETKSKPIFVYALPTDDKVRDATISLLEFERWQLAFHSVGIFEDQESVNRKVLARFTNVCEKQFSSLAVRDRIVRYLEEAVVA